jgi:hypothetical protein
LSGLFACLAGFSLQGMSTPFAPTNFSIVTVQATSPLATEPGNNPAIFTFFRGGDTNSAFAVSFKISGTASNGVDYEAITNSISFAAGDISTNLIITPISEPSATGYKTVILTLPHHDGSEFSVGPLERARAYITYNYSNVPPVVSIVTPTNGKTYLSLPNIEIAANASDSNGWVTTVEFFANNKSVGVATNKSVGNPFAGTLPWRGRHESRFEFVWTNVPPGDYALTALATDNAGLQTTSSAVDVSVSTNLPAPMVRIVNPEAGTEFPDLAPINIYAAATETGGVIKTVEFLANGISLGVATNYLAAEPSSQFHLRTQWLPFFFRWTNAPVGSNSLTVVATDNNGTQAESAAVGVTVSTNAYHYRWGR